MASKKQSRTGASKDRDIYAVLHQDHERVAGLLARLTKAGDGDREALLKQIKTELERHNPAEEIVFYPKLKEAAGDLIDEAIDEHDEAESMLNELESMSPDSEEWTERCTELQHAVQEHIEEEESEIFKVAREVFNEDQARQLGEELTFEKDQVAA